MKGKNKISLKKNALPRIFEANSDESDDEGDACQSVCETQSAQCATNQSAQGAKNRANPNDAFDNINGIINSTQTGRANRANSDDDVNIVDVPGVPSVFRIENPSKKRDLGEKKNIGVDDACQSVCATQSAQRATNQSAQGAKTQSNEFNGNGERPPIKCCDSFELYNILKAEHGIVRQAYIELEAKRCFEVMQLEKEKKKLEIKIEIQKDHIKYLKKKTQNKEQSVKSLKMLLKNLREQSILSKEAYEVLKVIYILSTIHFNLYDFAKLTFILSRTNKSVNRHSLLILK